MNKRAIMRIGGLSLGIVGTAMMAWGGLTAQMSGDYMGKKPVDQGSILDSAIGQAFAADFDDTTVPIAVYPESPEGSTLTPEELKQKMQMLQQEMEAMEQRGYDGGTEIDFSETVMAGEDNDSLMVDETVAETVTQADDFAASAVDIANPRWEEPLTPPRWNQAAAYGQDFNREGVVIPLDRPEQTAWIATPHWQRTSTQTQYAYDDSRPDSVMPPPQQVGDFRIQLGSFRSAGSAEAGWRQLLSQNADIFGVLEHSVEQADLGDRGIYYRLQVGSFASADTAKVICNEVKARNGDCLVVRR